MRSKTTARAYWLIVATWLGWKWFGGTPVTTATNSCRSSSFKSLGGFRRWPAALAGKLKSAAGVVDTVIEHNGKHPVRCCWACIVEEHVQLFVVLTRDFAADKDNIVGPFASSGSAFAWARIVCNRKQKEGGTIKSAPDHWIKIVGRTKTLYECHIVPLATPESE